MIAKLLSLVFLVAGVIAAQSAPPRKDIPAIAKAANGAIVSIIMSDEDGRPIAQGSGFLISRDGAVVTNYHVISEGTSAVVRFPGGAFFIVDGVLASDKDRDIAVIKAHGMNFHTVSLGDSDRLRIGEDVVAIGNPLSLESSVSNGIVSGIRATQRGDEKLIQITAPISPGSSGGPLFNMSGEVVGITTSRARDGENLNFAVPINEVKHLVDAYEHLHDSGWSVVGVFPNETDAVNSEKHDEDARPSSVKPTAARSYFTQLYDAGGFAEIVAEDKENPLRQYYVCYNDDDSAGEFFVFTATRFDQEYSDAAVALTKFAEQYRDKGLTHGEAMHDPKAVQALQTMKKVQEATPYVHFWVGDWTKWNSLPRLEGPGFQMGALDADIYKKGVKEGVGAWGWDQNSNSWVNYRSRTITDNVSEELTYRLAIEPRTLRYRETGKAIYSAGKGETKVSDSKSFEESGACEEFPDKRPN